MNISKLHDLIKETQNDNWKAYINFVNSGDMAKYNSDMDDIVTKICNFPSKDIAKLVKDANDYWVLGWALLATKMKEEM